MRQPAAFAATAGSAFLPNLDKPAGTNALKWEDVKAAAMIASAEPTSASPNGSDITRSGTQLESSEAAASISKLLQLGRQDKAPTVA